MLQSVILNEHIANAVERESDRRMSLLDKQKGELSEKWQMSEQNVMSKY